MKKDFNKIAVFTSGGDAPGMNACVRAVVRYGIHQNLKVYGIINGYEGMINGEIVEIESHEVGNIIRLGGTIIKSARSEEFRTEKGMKAAFTSLKNAKIDGVVAIGGDGTFKGANEFSNKFNIPFIGVPATIDNDIYGSDYAIGYDSAINTVVQAVDKIRDTAEAHNRLFIVEVMGRDAGFIALRSGIAVGAEAVLIPEMDTHIDSLVSLLEKGWKRKKSGCVVIVAEGDEAGGAFEIAKKVGKTITDYEIRVSVLGHMQRGGSPSCMDRVLATRLGVAAVEALIKGKSSQMVGVINNTVRFTPFEKSGKHHKTLNKDLLKLTQILS